MTSKKSIGEFIKAPTAKKIRQPSSKVMKSTPDIDVIQESSSDSSGHGIISYGTISQEHARPRVKGDVSSMSRLHMPSLDIGQSTTSISSSVTRFRNDFDQLKCKMRVFGESLNLCRCIADDFKNKLTTMEKRLENLEKRQKVFKSASNYSAIIQKNKRLSTKTLKDAKKLQMCGTEEEMREVAARICRNYLHGHWKTVDPRDLAFKRISGGLSNFLYYVALPDDPSKLRGYHPRDSSPETTEESDLDSMDSKIMKKASAPMRIPSFTSIEEPKKVLLRIYGQVHGERAMDAIVTESVIFTLLSERKLGPKLHGVFSGGRIEEYIPARSLHMKQLSDPAISMKIAEKLAAVHSMEIPLSKEPNWMWKTMGKWLKTVKDESLTEGKGKDENEDRIIKILNSVDFDKEIEWLKKYLASVDSPVVFCHNDLQEGNILYIEDHPPPTTEEEESGLFVGQSFDSDTGSIKENKYPFDHFDDADTSDTIISRLSDTGEPKLVLIDFEYCAYNHRGFDIANHFQEWAYDYTNPEPPFYFEYQEMMPTLEQKEIFIREYLKHNVAIMQEEKGITREVCIDDVNKLLEEVEAFAAASHLFWTLWSIVNASKSQIPFGYWEYGLSRLENYQRLKQEAIKKDKSGLPQKRKICEVDI